MAVLLGISVAVAAAVLGAGLFRARTGRWPSSPDSRAGRLVVRGLAILVILGLAIQLVPYGRDHSNPPVLAEPQWDSARTADLVRRACYDCHSNEVVWPWYSNIAPVSWLVLRDVEQGRDELNFSEWGRRQEADEILESVVEGEMPPSMYEWLHSSARFTDAERADLIRGLEATFGRGD